MRSALMSCFRGFLSLTMLGGMASMAFGQVPTAAESEANRAAFGQIVTMAPGTRAEVRMKAAMHVEELQTMSRAIALEPNLAKKNTLVQKQATMALHFQLEERAAPQLGNRQAAEEIGSVMTLPNPALNHVLLWNHAALDMTSLDFSKPNDGLPHPEFGEQLGPPCTSRAMALVHMAMFEALNAIEKKYPSYKGAGLTGTVQSKALATLGVAVASVTAATYDENTAIEEAAYDMLSKLYPLKIGFLNAVYHDPDTFAIATIFHAATGTQIANGKKLGTAIAEEIIKERTGDGAGTLSGGTPPDFGRCVTGFAYANLGPANPSTPAQWVWTPDPIRPTNQSTLALGSNWGAVTPFVISGVPSFRPAPLDFGGQLFQDSVTLSRLEGGDPAPPTPSDAIGAVATPTTRTPEQTEIGTFWAYDGTAGLCAPPRLYNMLLTSIATSEKPVTNAVEMARLLALANVAMADAAIAAWDAKYFYRVGRPVTGLRKTPGGALAGWTPLGAPSSNGVTYNVTPPFPAYPSGHATFGGALFAVMRGFWGVDAYDSATNFVFVSDENNGFNQDPRTHLNRPLKPRWFNSFAQAEAENAMSRVYLGIHWSVDADAGVAQGNKVGAAVMAGLYVKP